MSGETLSTKSIPVKRSRGIHWSILWSLVFFAAVLVGLFVDLPIARSGITEQLPGELRKLITLAEVFAHGLGVAVILLSIVVLVPERKRQVLRVAACAFLSGVTASGLKLVVARLRPYRAEEAWPETAWGTFHGFLPSVFDPQTTDAVGHAIQSFPSGHTATAVGLAIGLSWMFPRGKWLFAALAILAASQRIEVRAHYLSDTLMGASIAFMVGGAMIRDNFLNRWFTRFEKRPSSNSPPAAELESDHKKVA